MSQFNEPWERVRVQYGYPLLIDEVDATPEQMVRIVACVNACAGIPTYQLTAEDDKPTDLGGVIDELRKQRDELLAALERAYIVATICSDWMSEIEMPDGWTTTCEERVKIGEAIDSAKGINPVVKESLITETTAPALVFYPAGSLGEEV